MSDPLLYTLRKAAPLLAISESTLRDLVAQGRVATVQLRPGGDMFIRRIDLESFVAQLRPESRARSVTNGITNRTAPGRGRVGFRRLEPITAVVVERA